MLLHLGADVAVPLERLMFILNARGIAPVTRAYVDKAQREHRYTPCAGRPKSYAILHEHGREVVYASQLAASTLEKRLREELSYKFLAETAVLTAFWKE